MAAIVAYGASGESGARSGLADAAAPSAPKRVSSTSGSPFVADPWTIGQRTWWRVGADAVLRLAGDLACASHGPRTFCERLVSRLERDGRNRALLE